MLALSLPNGFASRSPRTHCSAFRRHQSRRQRGTRFVRPHPFPQHLLLSALGPIKQHAGHHVGQHAGYPQVARNPILHSFALCKTSTSLFSCSCALFRKKHRGWGREQVIGHKPRRMNVCRKRSSGQDGRPESRLADEGSLTGALLRNVAVLLLAAHKCHKCFLLRTYRKTVCKPFLMNTYKTKDLKFFAMNTYKKQGGWGGLFLSTCSEPWDHKI